MRRWTRFNFVFLSTIILSFLLIRSTKHYLPRTPWNTNFDEREQDPLVPFPWDVKLKNVIRRYLGSINPIPDPQIPLGQNNSKLILFYTQKWGPDFIEKPWKWPTDGTLHYPDPVFYCPKKCTTTMDRGLVEEAHAVVFSTRDVEDTDVAESLKLERNQNQIWVGFTLEAPLHHNPDALGQLDYLFNWTWTYRQDSDVQLLYGYFYKLESPRPISEIQIPDTQALRTKKLAASLISNCGAKSKRDEVIGEMKKYVSVDSFGGCGRKCPVTDCRSWIASQYKFFFAFENSLCQDYITEKFFHPFEVGLVPVTYGLGNYAEVAPPHSHINALDFPTVKALAEYLVFLDQNDEEYLKYFNWKQEYALGPHGLADDGGGPGFAAQLCSFCIKLWEPVTFTQQITNFYDWWNQSGTPRQIQSVSTTRLPQDTETACVDPEEIFHGGYLAQGQ